MNAEAASTKVVRCPFDMDQAPVSGKRLEGGRLWTLGARSRFGKGPR
jgi:hypothetical protein